MSRKVFQTLASLVDAHNRCVKERNEEWRHRHRERIESIVREHFPSGSGFDSGTQILLRACMSESLVFETAFHHMNEDGFYAGWTEHTVRVYPSLANGFRLTISGENRNEIKEYIHECFGHALDSDDEYDQNAHALRQAEWAFAAH